MNFPTLMNKVMNEEAKPKETSKIKELLSTLSYKQEQLERGVGSSPSAANKAVEDAEQAIIDYVENLEAPAKESETLKEIEMLQKHLKDAQKDLDNWEKWLGEVLTDFRIEYDAHPQGMKSALTDWMRRRHKGE